MTIIDYQWWVKLNWLAPIGEIRNNSSNRKIVFHDWSGSENNKQKICRRTDQSKNKCILKILTRKSTEVNWWRTVSFDIIACRTVLDTQAKKTDNESIFRSQNFLVKPRWLAVALLTSSLWLDRRILKAKMFWFRLFRLDMNSTRVLETEIMIENAQYC